MTREEVWLIVVVQPSKGRLGMMGLAPRSGVTRLVEMYVRDIKGQQSSDGVAISIRVPEGA